MSKETEAWRPGARIGDFLLRERLGKGSMGVVYRCRHHETGTQYAIKALPLSAGSYLAQRFEREGQAQAAVDAHANVLRVRSAGKAAGHLYIVMDLASGGDLESRLRQGPLPPRQAARMIEQLAQGLAHVHACGVLHRDLKPANVLFDSEGTPMLVDFGLALHDRESGALTRAGDLIGTPTYMAPEQARGKHKDVDGRADVYGLGAILYHALTGRRPYEGATTMEVVSQVLKTDPPRPRSVEPSIPPELEAICVKAMARAPEDRYSSARELGEALEHFLRSPAPPPQAKISRRGPALLLAGVGAVLLAGASLVVALGPERTDAPSPGDPAAVPSDTDTQASTSALIDPDRLAWSLREGALARCVIDHTLEIKQPKDEQPRWREQGFRSATRAAFAWKITRVGPTRVTTEATLESLRVDRRSAYGSVKYDSEQDSDKSPFARALGKQFELDFDPGTGEVLSVRGILNLQEAIDQGVKAEGQSLRKILYEVPQFRSQVRMRNFLNQVFFIFPGVQHKDPTQPWERLERIEDAPRPVVSQRDGRWNMAQVMGLPSAQEGLVRRFEARRQESAWAIEWSAKGRKRSFQGKARLEQGLVRRSEISETQTRHNGRGPGDRIIEQTLVLELKG